MRISDWSSDVCSSDLRVIEVLGSALQGSDRPLLVTSGLLGLARGATEADLPGPAAPRLSEAAACAQTERGVRAETVRMATSVSGRNNHRFIPLVIRLAREEGESAKSGEGWCYYGKE